MILILIRIAEIGDKNGVINLLKQFMIFEKAELLTEDQYESMFETVIRNPQKVLFVVAEEGNQLIGMLTMVFGYSTWKGKAYAIIDDVFVLSDRRFRGVATSLFRYAFKISRERDCARVDLVTEIDNYTAQELYKKLGFNQVPRIPFTKDL